MACKHTILIDSLKATCSQIFLLAASESPDEADLAPAERQKSRCTRTQDISRHFKSAKETFFAGELCLIRC